MKAFILLALTCLVSACSGDKLPEFNRLETLRVLALQASNPERSVGQTTTIQPLVSDSKGAGRTLTYSVTACTDPGIGLGVYPDCAGAKDVQVIATDVALNTLTAPNYTGNAPTFNVTIPSSVLDGKTDAEKFNGVQYIVLYTIKASDGTVLSSFKRITVTNKADALQNQNPTLNSILSNDSTLSSLPLSPVNFKPSYTGSAKESYLGFTETGGYGTLTEKLITSWFVSDGSLGFYRTEDETENSFSISYDPSTPVIIVAVLRDNRGGESFIKLEL